MTRRLLIAAALVLSALLLTAPGPAQAPPERTASVVAKKPPPCTPYKWRTLRRVAMQTYSRAFPQRHMRKRTRKVAKALIRCGGKRKDRLVRRYIKAHKYKHGQRFYWTIQRARLSWADKVWAVRTSSCESGRDPRKNTGNGYFGAHQWLPATAYSAGFKVRPDFTGLAEQDVRAVRWRHIAGRGQWPNCG